MGKIARRGTTAGALALAGALAFSTAAAADDIHPGNPDITGDPEVAEDTGSPAIWRFADRDRVGTALMAAKRTDITGDGGSGWGDTAILATSGGGSPDGFADALAAAPLADHLDAPVLLNSPGTNALRSDVAEYLTQFEEVIVVGGTQIFNESIFNEVDGFSDARRIEGANRYQTAIALADEALAAGGDTEGPINAFLASGTDFPDALSAGTAAAATGGVVLLTNGSDRLDRHTYDQLQTSPYDNSSIIAVGGPAAAAAAVGNQGDPIEVNAEVVGDDRYETAVEVAETYVAGGYIQDGESHAAGNFVIASGQDYPDAVVGGAYAANVNGFLLLTRPDQLTNATADFLTDDYDRLGVENVFVFGGPDSIQRSVSQEIADLEWRY